MPDNKNNSEDTMAQSSAAGAMSTTSRKPFAKATKAFPGGMMNHEFIEIVKERLERAQAWSNGEFNNHQKKNIQKVKWTTEFFQASW